VSVEAEEVEQEAAVEAASVEEEVEDSEEEAEEVDLEADAEVINHQNYITASKSLRLSCIGFLR